MGAQIKTVVKQLSASASEGSARGHIVTVDRPEAKGGSNRGPMGGELMLMGIGGCFMSNLLAAVAARGLAIDDLSTEVSAVLEDGPPRFSSVTLTVSTAFSDRAALQEMVDQAERNCLAVNTVKAAVEFGVTLA